MSRLLYDFVDKSILLLQEYGFFAGALLIILESMIPILPLGIFVAFNFNAYGFFIGFLISYLSTIFGCVLAYFLSKRLFSVYISKKSKDSERLDRIVKVFKNVKFSNLVLIIALPFSPAFLINIAAGTVKMNLKKFIAALFISKISIVYFWGMVGKSFIESLGDIDSLIIISLLLLFCYFLSKIVEKKLKLF